MKKAILAAMLVLALTAGIAACGGSEESTPAPAPETETSGTDTSTSSGTVTVSGTEFAFDPATLEVPADTPTTIEFTNSGSIEHDLTIEGYEEDALIATAGQTQTGDFTLPAGTYKFFCSIPGHESAGMVGTIEVA